ncbi:MAG: copper resistance protein B [Pseudoxanthomonas sp.]
MNTSLKLLCAATAFALAHATPTFAQAASNCTPEHAAMGHCEMPASTQHTHTSHNVTPQATPSCTPEHAAMGHCTPSIPAPLEQDDDCPPEHAAMGHCTPRKASLREPREPIPVLTDADRAAAFPPLKHAHSHGSGIHSLMLFNRLEAWDANPGNGQAWEGSAWIGGDVQRLWLRSEGDREHGRTSSANLEALYGRSLDAWWDVVAGVRHDFRPADSRTWAALGVRGIAPYRFEVGVTGYLGESGHTAASVEIEYDVLFTNRLILQPLLEARLNGKDDPLRHAGYGLSGIEAGLRLRYEINRRFAPYIGVAHERSFGKTADYLRNDGEATRETRWLAGVRVWF